MKLLLNSTSWILSALIIVLIAILLSMFILYLIHKYIPTRTLKKNHDVAGYTFGIVGILYSVILGFTVVNEQTRNNDVLQTIYTEAVALADLYREADFFPVSNRNAIRASLHSYAEYVIQNEWGISNTNAISIEGQEVIKKIWDSYHDVDLQDAKMKIWYETSISKLDTFMNARIARQFSAWEHLGSMMWTILLTGGIITIGFMYFFGLENFRSHMIMTSLLTGYISFMLFLVYSLDHAYSGAQNTQPEALEQVTRLFEHWDHDTASP